MDNNNKIAIPTGPQVNPFLLEEFISKGEPQTVQLFDYIKNPLDKTPAKTLIRFLSKYTIICYLCF